MRYDIYLTQATAEAKAELAKHFRMCKCCDFENVIWLSAFSYNGDISIHGVGYFDEDSLELPVKVPTPQKVCHFDVLDALAHGYTVILTPDVGEFVDLISRYLK